MKPVRVSELAAWMGGQPLGFSESVVASTFALDSQSVVPGDLFLAIKGERVDGHDFVPSALERGAIGSISERSVPPPTIQVENLVEALAMLAEHFRSQFTGPVVGITGSAGKTTTKELVASALKPLGPVLKTRGNRNTEYTAPLLWADLEPTDKAVVVEMSMRGFGQVRHLAAFSRPTIGVITNVGYAHMQQVGSRQGIADAKGELLELLPKDGFAVLWHEDEYLDCLKSKTEAKSVTFGTRTGSDCQILSYRPLSWQSAVVGGVCRGFMWKAEIPAVGKHIALNAAAAVLVASLLDVDPAVAAGHLTETTLPPLRMEVVEREGTTILLDTYNASPPSMIAAIETLGELPVSGRRLAVIGEMKELGAYTDDAHKAVGKALAESSISKVVFYGAAMSIALEEAIRLGMPSDNVSMASSLDSVKEFLSRVEVGDAILVKGSRSLELERALDREGQH